MRPVHELAQIIDTYSDDFIATCSPNGYVQRILHALQICRTSALGGHVDACDRCGHVRISYNSCRNPGIVPNARIHSGRPGLRPGNRICCR